MNLEETEMSKLSQKKYESNKRFNDKTYEQLGFRSRREERLDELIALGATKRAVSKSVYMISAIKDQLSRDGITIDMLGDDKKYIPPVESKEPKKYMVYMITQEHEEVIGTNDEDGNITWLDDEEYVAVFQTLNMAKQYVAKKYKTKPYPEDWTFRIYGRYFEVMTKADAVLAYRELIKNASVEAKNKGASPIDYFKNKYGTDNVEIITINDIEL